VKVKCCHAQVLPRGFVLPSSTSVIGEPFVWRVHDTTGQTHVVGDRSPFHLFRSPSLADGQSFSYTFKGAGSYSVLDESTGFHSGIGIRPRTSALFATVGQRVRITAATTAPKRAWRQWRTQILRPGESGFHAWSGAPSADFIPQRPGVFLFRTRLYDIHLRQAINWSPVLTVRAQQGS
jgi:hypothetical protein